MQVGAASSPRKHSGGMYGVSRPLLLVVYLCFFRGALGETNSTNVHAASFSMRGASGQVRFVEDGPDQNVTIRVDLTGLEPGNYTWAVHEKPMVYGQQPVCDDALIGGVYTQGGNPSAVQGVSESGRWNASYSDARMRLKGPQSITGRTLVLQEEASRERYCAGLANSRETITAVARFGAPFAGTVTFRQERDDPEAATTIWVDLYDVSDAMTSMTYAWRVSSSSGYNHDLDLQTRCAETSPDVYNPQRLDAMACGIENPSGCPIGHLTGKFGDVTVKPLPSAATQYFIDTNLPLSGGGSSVMGKSLVFSGTSGDSVACSPILELKPKSVEALFSVRNVSGTIRFSQRSPYDATELAVQLENLGGSATGLHLQELPLSPRIDAGDWLAGPDSVAGRHNPHGITGAPPPPAVGTHDQYEVGDLSGKFGLLTGRESVNATFLDWNLPLFGGESIVGRSLVILDARGERWLHAAIGHPTAEQKTVKAVFKAPCVGKIVMSQAAGDPYADTGIFVEMAHADGSDTTAGHGWHVHAHPVADDHISATGRCSSCAGHFNPFAVALGASYTGCSPGSPGRCELGDLSGKHGRLTVTGRANRGAGRFYFVETGLPLSGVHSVAGRSVVLHAADGGSPRFSCADLLEFPAAEAAADLWSRGPVSGEISFRQESVFDPVRVRVNVAGLGSLAGGWHVHSLPVDESADSAPCGAASVRGHYNPFGVVGSPARGTQDMYEVGDLSGKFGGFSGSPDARDRVYRDTNLALEGPRSVVGRSLVVHRSADGSRWVCATLHRKTHQDDFVMKARAVVNTPEYTGYATLIQTRYRTGALGDTTVDFELQSNVAEVDTFYWNLHPGQTNEDSCSESSSIFNPHEVSLSNEYGSQCDTKSQLRCALGDLTGKHGNMSSAVKRAVYTDTNLPITGQDSVLGLSLHLISTNRGQFACGTVEPDPSTGRVEYLSYPSSTVFDPYKFRQTLYDHLKSAEMWQIVATHSPQINPTKDCAVLKFYFIGTGLDDMDCEFKQKANSDELGEYSPTSQCKDASGGANRAMTCGSDVFSLVLAHFSLVIVHFAVLRRLLY